MNNYTKISDKLLQNTKLKLTSRVVYARLAYRMNLSVAHNSDFYDSKCNSYYIVYQIKDLMHDCGIGKNAVINALKQLVDVGLLIKRPMVRFMELMLPEFHSQTPRSHKTKLSYRTKNKTNNNKINTVTNTAKPRKTRAKPVNHINRWLNATSATLHNKRLAENIARIANKNEKQARYLFKQISKLRGRTVSFYNVKRVHLEDIPGLTRKLAQIHAYQIDPRYKFIKKSNYIGFVINSLKRFFMGKFSNLKFNTDPEYRKAAKLW